MVRFVADRMLGRLARLLRLVGYDTVYAPEMPPARLLEIHRREERIILTRGQAEKRFPGLDGLFSVQSEHAPQQLREVAERFRLDVRSGLWTRCTLCNGVIQETDKSTVKEAVPPRVFEVYEEFFRCLTCGHIYWKGSHVDRVLKHLASILNPPEEALPPLSDD